MQQAFKTDKNSSIANKRIQTLLQHIQINLHPETNAITLSIPLQRMQENTPSATVTQQEQNQKQKPKQIVSTVGVQDKKQVVPTVKEYSVEEVSKHNTESDCWIIVNGQVLDATRFLNKHPGGKQVLLLWAGKDATTEFNMFHKKDAIEKYAPEIIIGNVIATRSTL